MEQQQNRQDPGQQIPPAVAPQLTMFRKTVSKDPMQNYVWASLSLGGVGLCFLLFACIGWFLFAGVFGIPLGLLSVSFGIACLRRKELQKGKYLLGARLGLILGIVVVVLAVTALVLGLVFPAELDAFFKELMQSLTEIA